MTAFEKRREREPAGDFQARRTVLMVRVIFPLILFVG
jgi:hypothetical protein